MTTEIEKQFFDTFGIEPKYYYSNHYVFEAMLEDECTDNNREKCKTCKDVRKSYPQITDHLLLELICIANQKDIYIEVEGTDIETMKNKLLENFIHFIRLVPEQQVRALFEGMKK